MKKTLFTCMLFGMTQFVIAQTLEWAKSSGGSMDDQIWTVVTDPEGNIYTGGHFQGTADYDPGTDVKELTAVGAYDCFLQKLDENGNLIWAISFGGPGVETVLDIDIDQDGNVYAVGYFNDSIDLDPSAAKHIKKSNGKDDAYVLKVDKNGAYLWSHTFGSDFNHDGLTAVSVAQNGDVLLAGHYDGIIDFDFGPDTLNVFSLDRFDVVVLRLDSDGELVWVNNYHGMFNALAQDIKEDSEQNIYVTGGYEAWMDFDSDSGSNNILTGIGSVDIFLFKIDSSGKDLWVRSFGGTLSEEGRQICTKEDGAVYITAKYESADMVINGEVLPYTSGFDLVVMKLDADGNFLWDYHLNGDNNEFGNGIDIDTSGKILISGHCGSSIDFDNSDEDFIWNKPGNDPGAYLTVLEPSDGSLINAFRIVSKPGSSFSSLYIDENNNAFLSGYYVSFVDLDPSVDKYILNSAGSGDVFIAKYKLPGEYSRFTQTVSNLEIDKVNFSIYPNPTNDKVFVNGLNKSDSYQLLCSSGQVMLKGEFSPFNQEIDLSNLSSGVYFLILNGQAIKIIKD